MLDDGIVIEGRFHKETGLVDLGQGKMFRYWGRYFNGKHAYVWVDYRLGQLVDGDSGEMIYTEPEEGALRFYEEDESAVIVSCTNGVERPIEPCTADWQILNHVLERIQDVAN